MSYDLRATSPTEQIACIKMCISLLTTLPLIFFSMFLSSSSSRLMASSVGLGAPWKVTTTMLMLSRLPCQQRNENENHFLQIHQ